MKSKYILSVLFLSLALSLSSCGKFLDKFPDSSQVNVDSKEKIRELLSTAYPRASYFRFLELRTDNVGRRTGSYDYEKSRLNNAMYHWREYDEEDLDSPVNYWVECYRGIANANKALELLASYKDKSDKELRSLYGEALLLRAYLHFMLANIWSPAYEGQASKNLKGIPYIDEVEKTAFKKYHQSNLYDLYQNIERDLRVGLSIVDDSYYQHPYYRFNKKAAYAFASRFFLYVGKWQDVIDYSSAILGYEPQNDLWKWPGERIYSKWSYQERVERFDNPRSKENLLTVTTESLWASNYINDIYGFNERYYNKIAYLQGEKAPTSLEAYTQGVQRARDPIYYPKFEEFVDKEGTLNEKRGHYVDNVLFRMPEVLLNRAEAYAMIGNPVLALNDLRAFINDRKAIGAPEPNLEEFRLVDQKTRDVIQPYYRPLTAEKASLVYVISQYRRMEFIHEGLRWFDIRRFRIKVDRNLPGGVQVPSDILQVQDKRKVLPLPSIAKVNGVE